MPRTYQIANNKYQHWDVKILLCNKFYYRRGGDCIYTMNLEQLLKSHGHEVAIFSQQYPLNEPSPWSKYWPTEFKMKPSLHMFDSLLRPFGLGSVQKQFKAILDDFQPDVVHLNNIHTQLSPILAELAHERGIRVIWTLHDTKLVCPCYTCMRDGKWCEECFADKRAVLHHKCMTGGVLGSYIGYQEAKTWTAERLQQSVDAFICPSQFLANTMKRGGYEADKLYVIHNFIAEYKVKAVNREKQDYYVFLGRLTSIKGIYTLCEAASTQPYQLIVIGGGDAEETLRTKYAQSKQIIFKGQLDWNEIKPLVACSKFTVVPSEWSENNPFSIIESLSLGTPVLGARIGGIPELINPSNGITFTSGDKNDLARKIEEMWQKDFDYQKIAEDALSIYGDDSHYHNLLTMYNR